jgi:hypothetical protein
MNSLVHNTQAAIIQRKCILDNVVAAHKLFIMQNIENKKILFS